MRTGNPADRMSSLIRRSAASGRTDGRWCERVSERRKGLAGLMSSAVGRGLGGSRVSTAHFTVTYDGPGVRDHRIDVRQLAPSLLALADAFVIANEELGDGLTPPPELQVVASRESSFSVDLLLDIQPVVDLLNSAPALASGTATTLVGASMAAVRWVKKRSRKGRETSVVTVSPGRIRVQWPDGTVMDTTSEAATLVENMDFRRSARDALLPLEGSDVTSVKIDPEQGPSLLLERADLSGFDLPEPEDESLSVGTREVLVSVITLGFRTDHKWRVTDGSTPFWVTVDDLAFLMKVDDNEPFARHDTLRCTLTERQYQRPNGSLRIERSISKVHEHRHAEPHPRLPLDVQGS